MRKHSALLVAATLVVGASVAAAATPAPQKRASPTFYYWLHPKLGHVKVDKTTNAMIKPGSARRAEEAERSYQPLR